jgi:hypothetical protein
VLLSSLDWTWQSFEVVVKKDVLASRDHVVVTASQAKYQPLILSENHLLISADFRRHQLAVN